MPRVKRAQVFPGEVGDVLRVAAGDVLVGQVFEERLADRAIDGRGRGRQGAFHLVENHALVPQPALRVSGLFKLEADPLLLEGVFVESREEGRIEVDLEEVHVVLGVAGAEQVHRPVGARERVHERREGASGHAEEGVADRKTLRAREDHVLEDVRDAGGVRWWRREKDGEGVVVVGALDVDVLRARALVLEFEVLALEPCQRFPALDRVTADRARGCDSHVNC